MVGTNIGIDCAWDAFCKLATADLPTETLDTCLAARIVLGSKPNGGVALRHERRLVLQGQQPKLLTNNVRNVTSPHQYAVGMKQGPELLHKIVSAHIALHQDAAMASVDVKNAHGTIEWGAVQKEIEALDKNLWKWCAVLFHELTCKLDDGEIITHSKKKGAWSRDA